MIMKAAPWILGALIILGTGIGAYILGTRNGATTIVRPTETRIIREKIPGEVQVVTEPADPADPLQDPVEYEYATMDTTLASESGATSVDLGIGYNERDNTFDLAARITEKPRKAAFLRPMAGVGVGFKDGLEEADVSGGVLIRGKYSVQAYVNTRQTIGVRVGVIF